MSSLLRVTPDDLAGLDFDALMRLLADPRQAEIEADRAIVAEEGLRGFIPLAWHAIEGSETSYRGNWHIDAMCDHLDAVSKGEIRRLAIAVPPRSMKSITVAIMFPAHDWIKNPWRRFLFSSYAHNLSMRDSTRCRRVIQSPWYQARWGHCYSITSDQNTKVRFDNNKNGYRLSTSVKGQLTGEGGDIICFPYDQKILTETGPVEIGQIVDARAEVRVWSVDVRTGHVALKPVVGWHRNPGRAIVRVTLGDGTSIRCTADHRLWTMRGWVQAGDLLASDVLPRPPLPDVRDGLVRHTEAAGQGAARVAGPDDFTDLCFSKARDCGLIAPRPIAGPACALGDALPRLAPPDLLNRGRAHAEPRSESFGRLRRGRNGNRLLAREDGAGALLQDGEGAVPLGIGDVLGARAVRQVVEPGVAPVPVQVADLCAGRRWANEGQQHGLMDKDDVALAVAAPVEARVSVVRGRLDHAAIPLAPDAPEAGHRVGGEARDRSPVLVEVVAHADATFCLTVAEYHTMMACSDNCVPEAWECAPHTPGRYPAGCGCGLVLVRNCVDDPHNAHQAESEAIRQDTLQWWDEAMSTRLNDQKTGSYIIIQQRVHHNDLLGHVLAKKSAVPWTYLCLPAEFEPDHPNRWFRDPRKEEGELLWPEHVPRPELESIKEALGPYAAAGQLQQRPSPREGGFFKRGWFGFVDVAPADIRWVRGWDFAATEKQVMKSDPDYTASARVGYSPSTKLWYVGHIERFREDPDEVERRFIQRAEMDGDQVHVQIPQDPGQAGKGQARNMVRLLPKHSVVAAPVTGDKMSRAHPWAAKAGAGLVKLVKGGWNEPFLVELTSFPTGAHDDQIDAVSAAFERLLSSSSAIVDFYQQQLRDKGIDPATLSISTPLQAAASATSPGDYQAKMAALMAAMKGSG